MWECNLYLYTEFMFMLIWITKYEESETTLGKVYLYNKIMRRKIAYGKVAILYFSFYVYLVYKILRKFKVELQLYYLYNKNYIIYIIKIWEENLHMQYIYLYTKTMIMLMWFI